MSGLLLKFAKNQYMKAGVMNQTGGLPQYTDFPEPIAQNENEIVVSVKAVALKHLDKGRASGQHYSSSATPRGGRVIGGDGVCLLPDGTRVYGVAVNGMLAERAVIAKDRIVKLPHNLDDATAAALANAVMGSAMGLRFKADIRAGDVVLINGATGFTGRVAVQVAKHYGAKKVIATGRNPKSLQDLLALGADEIIPLAQEDEKIIARLKEVHANTPLDIVMDYLWGHTVTMTLAALKGNGSFTHKTRYVSIGSITGDLIELSAAILRSVNLQITGSGLGSWSKDEVARLFTEILPELFQLAADGKLIVKTTKVALKDIANLWTQDVTDGQRLVITM